jgi:hypothetical protein
MYDATWTTNHFSCSPMQALLFAVSRKILQRSLTTLRPRPNNASKVRAPSFNTYQFLLSCDLSISLYLRSCPTILAFDFARKIGSAITPGTCILEPVGPHCVWDVINCYSQGAASVLQYWKRRRCELDWTRGLL